MKYVFQCRENGKQKKKGGKKPCIERKEEKGEMKAENGLEMGDEVMYFLGCRAKFKYFKIEMYQFDVSNFMILAQIFQLPSEFG